MGVALLLFLPNFLWLAHYHYPLLEFERNSRASGSRTLRGPLSFLTDQALIINSVLAILALAGMLWLLADQRARKFRFAGWAALFVIGDCCCSCLRTTTSFPSTRCCLLRVGSRWTGDGDQFPMGAPCVCFAGGALPCVARASGDAILSVDHFLAYRQAWRCFTPVRFEAQLERPLPQYFSEEFGWEEMARVTNVAYRALSETEREQTAIFANDYGEAAAIAFFGPRYGLPSSISKSETFWLWDRGRAQVPRRWCWAAMAWATANFSRRWRLWSGSTIRMRGQMNASIFLPVAGFNLSCISSGHASRPGDSWLAPQKRGWHSPWPTLTA